MLPISNERLSFAFDQLTPEDGGEFERFVNSFLILEIPSLRPVAGMHDGAMDAFVYQVGEEIYVFLQSSVTKDWSGKINRTITALIENGNKVRELIYCTNQPIIQKTAILRTELRQRGISLDVRDRSYFLASANATDKQTSVCEEFAKKFVNPILAAKRIEKGMEVVLTDSEERTALVFLDLSLRNRLSEMALTKVAFDSLVTFALRDSSQKCTKSAPEILVAVERILPSQDKARIALLTDNAIERLLHREEIKKAKRTGGFFLSAPTAVSVNERIISFASEKASLQEEIAGILRRLGTENGIDYPYESETLATDVVTILNYYFGTQGRVAAQAMAKGSEYVRLFSNAYDLTQSALREKKAGLLGIKALSEEQYLDLVPLAIESMVRAPSNLARNYFRNLADAYMLTFFLQETPDVQKTVSKILLSGRLIVDTSYLVPCLAETALPDSERVFTGLLRSASAAGITLFVTDSVINEIITHLKRVRFSYSQRSSAPTDFGGTFASEITEILLIRAFLKAKKENRFASFDEFIYQFIGDQDPRSDIIDTLKTLFGIEYNDFAGDFKKIDKELAEKLIYEWKAARNRRADMDENAFNILIRHDVNAYLLVQQLRASEQTSHKYGYSSWWLTLVRTAYRIQKRVEKANQIQFPTPVTSCMSPEFLLRFVSIMPRKEGVADYLGESLPLSIELAGLGLIPADLREAATKALQVSADAPQYVQRRKIKEL